LIWNYQKKGIGMKSGDWPESEKIAKLERGEREGKEND